MSNYLLLQNCIVYYVTLMNIIVTLIITKNGYISHE